MIAGAWYLGPAASAGKVLGGGLLGLAANSGYQVYDLNQPQNANKKKTEIQPNRRQVTLL